METGVFFSSLIFVFSSLIVFHRFQIKDEKNISNFDMQGLEI
jgi:hypothetical protein